MVLTSFTEEPTPLARIPPFDIQDENTLCPADMEDSRDTNRQHISKCTTGTGLYKGLMFELVKHKAFNRLKINFQGITDATINWKKKKQRHKQQ